MLVNMLFVFYSKVLINFFYNEKKNGEIRKKFKKKN